jgi:hypothetical protein
MTRLDPRIAALGRRLAQERDSTQRLKGYLTSALATLTHDDLTCPDAWENLIYDVECALAVATACAARV